MRLIVIEVLVVDFGGGLFDPHYLHTLLHDVIKTWARPTFVFDVGDISFIHFSFISSGFGGHFRKFLCFGSSLVSSGGGGHFRKFLGYFRKFSSETFCLSEWACSF